MRTVFVVTRAIPLAPLSDGFTAALRALGCNILNLPLIEYMLCKENASAIASVFQNDTGANSWCVFPSPNSVAACKALLENNGLGSAEFRNINFAVQGTGTAVALKSLFNRDPDLVPETFNAEGMLDALLGRLKPGDKITILGADEGRTVVADGLSGAGFLAEKIPTHVTLPRTPESEENRTFRELSRESLVWIFMSPSAVQAAKGFNSKNGTEYTSECLSLSIGPATTSECKKQGFLMVKEARSYSESGLLDLVKETLLELPE